MSLHVSEWPYLLHRVEVKSGLAAGFWLASGGKGPRREAGRYGSSLLCQVHEVEARDKLLLSQERGTASHNLPDILQGLPWKA